MNFFGKNETLSKSIENFDSFDKIVFEKLSFNRFYNEKKSNKEIVDYISNLDYLKKVHYKDRWDVLVFTFFAMEQEEYSGNLLIVPHNQYSKIENHYKNLCCGIFSSEFTSIKDKNRKYTIIFDYGH
jgi:hypothetical protein